MGGNIIHKTINYIETFYKLGIFNVSYVFWYRFTLKTGIRRALFFQKKEFNYNEGFYKFHYFQLTSGHDQLIEDADKIVNGFVKYYSYHWFKVGNPPDWFLNPFNNNKFPQSNLHWTNLADFNPIVGDIKNIWEASRFDWLVTLSRAYRYTNDIKYLDTLNFWIKDWTDNNALNIGPNWKCGQEASIRLFNLLNSAIILQQSENPSEQLCDFIYSHLCRIKPNILYAVSQDNNHGTSEAAALFVGGAWLSTINKKKYPNAKGISSYGRKWLENRVEKLVSPDGSFSQYSVTYHRVFLDTICFAEFWREHMEIKLFSSNFYNKAKLATNWLLQIMDSSTGDCSNLGSNDGALFLNFNSCNYRDFRPTFQLANVLFNKKRAFQTGEWDEPLNLLGIDYEALDCLYNFKPSFVFSDGGFSILNFGESKVIIRWPNFKFRPAHNDVMHFDLWYKGVNIICDSGTYSYNPYIKVFPYDLKSVHFHNTVYFDDNEQMPQLSKFLLGNWIKANDVSEISNNEISGTSWFCSYNDHRGNFHKREIEYKDDSYLIIDTIRGSFKKATIGFNINDINCIVDNSFVICSLVTLTFLNSKVIRLSDSISSSYYMEFHKIKRVEVDVFSSGTYITEIKLKK